jgi:hypothetical protein
MTSLIASKKGKKLSFKYNKKKRRLFYQVGTKFAHPFLKIFQFDISKYRIRISFFSLCITEEKIENMPRTRCFVANLNFKFYNFYFVLFIACRWT